MAVYLRQFETTAQYTAAESTLATPNVSLINETMGVAFKPYVEPTPSRPEWVEIGGIKWATKNVGASSETDYGNYYQYGKGARQYVATSGESDYSGYEDPLASSADTATQVLGGNWRTPTRGELQSLINNTNYTWETNFNGSGVNGVKFTDKTDSSKYIFIPAAGCYEFGNLNYEGVSGKIWSSTPGDMKFAYALEFSDGDKAVRDVYNYGHSVRGVLGS